MDISEAQQSTLATVCDDIVAALGRVAERAAEALEAPAAIDPTVALAAPGNPMTGPRGAVTNLQARHADVRANLERIRRQPFVARVVVRWADGGTETYHVTKGSAAALGSVSDIKLATYASPLGRLSELPAGVTGTLERAGTEREFEILERALILPKRSARWDATVAEQWDALGEKLEFENWRAALESLRAFVEEQGRGLTDAFDVLAQIQADEEIAGLVVDKLRRRVVDRMALRDQPTLDRFQGEVFRMPLDRQVLLLGPPGSGKTTTLIQRLSSKRNPEGLLEEDQAALVRFGLDARFRRSDGWVMFSPTDLLQLYLRDAFNREDVPAAAGNLRTWERERRDLGRNVFGILRASADSGGFELAEDMQALPDDRSAAISALFDRFVQFANKLVLDRVAQAFEYLSRVNDTAVRVAALAVRKAIGSSERLELGDIGRLLDESENLKTQIARLRKDNGETQKRLAARMLRRDPGLIGELVEALPRLRPPVRDEDEEDEDEDEDAHMPRTKAPQAVALDLLMAALRSRARSLARGKKQLTGRPAKVFELLAARAPEDAELAPLGAQLVTAAELRAVVDAPRRTVAGLAAAYRRFRGTHADLLVQSLDRNKISGAECDVVLLAALGAARRLLLQDRRRLQGAKLPDWLDSVRQRYIVQVFVDEATDFSTVQLACMLELAHPALQSWFACGDFRQRITSHGIQERAELEWVAKNLGLRVVEACDISTGYRQSPRLQQLTRALETTEPLAVLDSPNANDDVHPLLAENLAGVALGEWLSARIVEVEQAIGRLPSIAVFIDGEDRIDPLVELVRPQLAAHNIPIVGCKDGRSVGDQQEVRVFDVQHIKGLEFEAVFFVSINQVFERIPSLFERFLYVGITRAATYLAVTCEGHLPEPLGRVRSHFSSDSWSA